MLTALTSSHCSSFIGSVYIVALLHWCVFSYMNMQLMIETRIRSVMHAGSSQAAWWGLDAVVWVGFFQMKRFNSALTSRVSGVGVFLLLQTLNWTWLVVVTCFPLHWLCLLPDLDHHLPLLLDRLFNFCCVTLQTAGANNQDQSNLQPISSLPWNAFIFKRGAHWLREILLTPKGAAEGRKTSGARKQWGSNEAMLELQRSGNNRQYLILSFPSLSSFYCV